jgi:hypothetical protein
VTHAIPSEQKFGLSVGGVFLAIAAFMWWRGYGSAPPVLGIVGGLLVFLGAVYPPLLRAPNRVWWRLAQTLGWINARILLTAFFALVMTPSGVCMRLLGRNPLRASRFDSNWTPYPARRRDPRHFEKLY